MGDERRDDASERGRADVYSSALIGAAAALTLVLVVLLVLAAFVASGGSVAEAAARVGVRPSTAKRHLADLRERSGLSTEQLVYAGRAGGWLVVPTLEPR